MNFIKVTFTILLVFTTQFVFAQYTEVINSNRPGVSRSAFSVGTNVAQLEVGPYILKEEHTPLKYEISGFGVDFAVRYGLLFEELELNIEGIYQNDKITDNRGFIAQESKRSNFKTFELEQNILFMILTKTRKKRTNQTYTAIMLIEHLNGNH